MTTAIMRHRENLSLCSNCWMTNCHPHVEVLTSIQQIHRLMYETSGELLGKLDKMAAANSPRCKYSSSPATHSQLINLSVDITKGVILTSDLAVLRKNRRGRNSAPSHYFSHDSKTEEWLTLFCSTCDNIFSVRNVATNNVRTVHWWRKRL